MNSYRFAAYQRNGGLRIIGKCLETFPRFVAKLQRVPEPQTDTMRFLVELTKAMPTAAEARRVFEHFEPTLPEHVRTIRIVLPDGGEIAIQSSRPHVPRTPKHPRRSGYG